MTNLSPVLTRIPAQATRVLLSRVPPSPLLSFTEKAAQRLREMAPPSSCLMMRVCEIQQLTGTPVVQLYERLVENRKLVYINASLEMDDSLFRPTNSSSTSTPATTPVSTPSSTTPVSPKRHLATDEQLLSRRFASISRYFTPKMYLNYHIIGVLQHSAVKWLNVEFTSKLRYKLITLNHFSVNLQTRLTEWDFNN